MDSKQIDDACGDFSALMFDLSQKAREAGRPDIAQAVAYIHDAFIPLRLNLIGEPPCTPKQLSEHAPYPDFTAKPARNRAA